VLAFKAAREGPSYWRGFILNSASKQSLLDKLKALPPGRVAEVEDFVDFLRTRTEAQRLTRDAHVGAKPRAARAIHHGAIANHQIESH